MGDWRPGVFRTSITNDSTVVGGCGTVVVTLLLLVLAVVDLA